MKATRDTWLEEQPRVVTGYIVHISDEDLGRLRSVSQPTLAGFGLDFLRALHAVLQAAGANL